MILLDSNIVVAAIFEDHAGHRDAVAVLNVNSAPLLLAAHSHAEAFVTLTRRGGTAPMALKPARVRKALLDMLDITRLVGLTPIETIDAIQEFAAIGIGPRLYDYLIGRTGLLHGAETIVTFNVRHMRSLFPRVPVLSPAAYLGTIA